MSKVADLNTHQKLAAIQQSIKVGKSQYNAFGKYYYRNAEDILEALKPYEGKYDVSFHIDEEIKSIDALESPIVYVVATAVIIDNLTGIRIASRGNAIIDFEAKGMQMPQRTGAASSYAKKYAMGNLLLLDDTKDSDATNEHGKGGTTSAPNTPASAPNPSLKAMTQEQQQNLLKGIADGKFTSVEKFLSKYKNDDNKKTVVAALKVAKEGKK